MDLDGEGEQPTLETLRTLVRNCRHGSPEAEDQGRPFFQAAVAFMGNENTPLDRMDGSATLGQIKEAIQQTATLVTNDGVLNEVRASLGSMRFFAAVAVDAWFNDDIPQVKRFAIKALFLEHLLLKGPDELMGTGDGLNRLSTGPC